MLQQKEAHADMQTWLIIWGMAASVAAGAPANQFPGRTLYPAVPVISMGDLERKFENYTIVDVRSPYEYEILHIRGAINIPLAEKDFILRMKALRSSTSKPIVVYCNGKTCMKSYKAVTRCRRKGIDGTIAYDQGVMDWARTYPDKAVLLGRSPINPRKLISEQRFKERLLSPARFESGIVSDDALVVDLRERFQREALGLFVGREMRASVGDHEALRRAIREARRKQSPLYLYDAAGKQVRWVQYFLESEGVQDYYFMEGGARAYFDMLRAQYTH